MSTIQSHDQWFTHNPQDGSDYEIGIGDPSWSTLQSLAQEALQAPGAFDFSAYLL